MQDKRGKNNLFYRYKSLINLGEKRDRDLRVDLRVKKGGGKIPYTGFYFSHRFLLLSPISDFILY